MLINCLRLFVVVIYCYHGDGRHVCTKFIRTTISNLVFYSLSVGGAMAMVVAGHIWSYTTIGLRLFVLPWQHVTLLVNKYT